MKITKLNSKEYDWGIKCKGWHLVNTEGLSVIKELMPSSAKEVKHRHINSQQFFYILNGQALFVIDGKEYTIDAHEGIHILPNVNHQIINETDEDVEFIVVSQPHAHGDRVVDK